MGLQGQGPRPHWWLLVPNCRQVDLQLPEAQKVACAPQASPSGRGWRLAGGGWGGVMVGDEGKGPPVFLPSCDSPAHHQWFSEHEQRPPIDKCALKMWQIYCSVHADKNTGTLEIKCNAKLKDSICLDFKFFTRSFDCLHCQTQRSFF